VFTDQRFQGRVYRLDVYPRCGGYSRLQGLFLDRRRGRGGVEGSLVQRGAGAMQLRRRNNGRHGGSHVWQDGRANAVDNGSGTNAGSTSVSGPARGGRWTRHGTRESITVRGRGGRREGRLMMQ
jgi:hypothetical protein